MPKTALEQWDETAANNTDMGGIDLSENVMRPPAVNNEMREHMAQVAKWLGDDTLASASTTDLGSVPGRYVSITGTTTITALGTIKAGTVKYVKFAGALTLTHNGTSLILPDGINITTVAGDTAIFVSEGSGNWICLAYQAAVRKPGFQSFPSSSTWNKPANLKYVVVEVWGGGGGGGSNTSAGGTGGTSSFGAHCSASGGAGGTSGAVGGAGGIGSNGDFNLRGTQGGNLDASRYGGSGGAAPRGGGGAATAAGSEPGGGGGSGVANSGLGGGGGYAIKTIIASSLGSSETVTVGAAGAAGGASAFAGAIGYVNVTEYFQ